MDSLVLKDLLKKADNNLAQAIKHRIINSKKGKIYESESFMLYTLGIDNEDGHLNGVLCLDDSCGEEVLKEADNFFKPINRDYVVWIRDHGNHNLEDILINRGFEPKRKPGSAGMIISKRIDPVDIPKGFEIKKVSNRREIDDFSSVIGDAFDKPLNVSREMVSSDEILISKNTKAFVIYEENIPVAAISIVISGDMAGLYWVGTIEDKRGFGLGSYITGIGTNEGFDAGAKAVVLQASMAGERLYKRLGYETITRYRWYPIRF